MNRLFFFTAAAALTIWLSVCAALTINVEEGFHGITYEEAILRCNSPECRKSREYSAILGRASWTLLHTMTVNYPDHPTAQDEADILQFFRLLAKFYPCRLCAENFHKELEKLPPRTASRKDLTIWLCELHNSVNARLGKPIFDCATVFDVWQRDPADGYCPDVCPVDFGSYAEDAASAHEEAVSYIVYQ